MGFLPRLLGLAGLLITFSFTSADAGAQTVTITGCASLSSTGGNGASNITIVCNPTIGSPGAPVCQRLDVTPPSSTNNPISITLSASCSVGSSAITSYTFTGPGVNTVQGGPSLSVTAPLATATYTVTATDMAGLRSNSATGTFTVGSLGGKDATVDLSACTAHGFNGKVMELAYSTGGNLRISSDKLGSFGNSDAVVLRFTTPPIGGDSSGIQFSQVAMTPQVFRVATLATQPCQIATSTGRSGAILASSYSKSPVFYLTVGGASSLGKVGLQANTTYFITVVNRNGYGGSPSCTTSSCGVLMDFTN